MIDNIKKFFSEKINTIDNETAPSRLRSVPIATCALLLEMAHADSEFSEEEKKNIISILEEHFDLDARDAQELIELADFERKESLDLWQFTNLINQNYKREDKIKVVETLWRVIYTDKEVDKHEEYLMRRLTFLLNLDHKDMIEAKFRARQDDQNI
jgi:uncharacterized tellurite resistance protein B-like protein